MHDNRADADIQLIAVNDLLFLRQHQRQLVQEGVLG